MKIYFVTGNEGKYSEAKEIIPELEKVDIDLDEIQGIDPKGIIEHKLKQAQKENLDGAIVVEDNSVYLDGLNGLPGPLIKWFMKTVNNDGLVKLSKLMGDGSSEAKVVIGFSRGNDEPMFFEGTIKGKIVEPRGQNGFGWDAIFQPEGFDKTFGEMTAEEKNSISMRKIAFEKLKSQLAS